MNIAIYTNGGPDRPTGVARYWVYLQGVVKKLGLACHWLDARKDTVDTSNLDPRSTLFITATQLAVKVPAEYAVIAVQHGCAGEHKARVPSWSCGGVIEAQKAVARRPSTLHVACSEWAAHYNRKHTGAIPDAIICGGVDTAKFKPSARQVERKSTKPIVLHHCADANKGASIIGAVARACPEFTFRLLSVAPADVPQAMQGADIWLCLSASEGLPTVVQEAMAVDLVVVGTNVGVLWPASVGEDTGATIFDWKLRSDAPHVAGLVRRAWASRNAARGRAWAAAHWGLPMFSDLWADCIRRAAKKLEVA